MTEMKWQSEEYNKILSLTHRKILTRKKKSKNILWKTQTHNGRVFFPSKSFVQSTSKDASCSFEPNWKDQSSGVLSSKTAERHASQNRKTIPWSCAAVDVSITQAIESVKMDA